jgi:hypothetical protein
VAADRSDAGTAPERSAVQEADGEVNLQAVTA